MGCLIEDCNATKKDGWAPIHLAARKGHADIVKYLASIVDDPNALATPNLAPIHPTGIIPYIQPMTTLNIAINYRHLETVKILASIIENSSDLIMPIIYRAAKRGNSSIINFLASTVEDPNAPRRLDGWTPTHFAAREGHANVVKVMVQLVKNPNYASAGGYTPIQVAALCGHTEVIKVLYSVVENPNAPDPDGCSLIHLAATGKI